MDLLNLHNNSGFAETSKSNEDYKCEQDAQTILDYSEIYRDKKRYKKALQKAQKMVSNTDKRVKEVKTGFEGLKKAKKINA